MRLVDDILAFRTGVVVFQVLDDAGLAEGVQALGDGGGVDQVPVTDLAGDHLVQLPELATTIQRVTHRDSLLVLGTRISH